MANSASVPPTISRVNGRVEMSLQTFRDFLAEAYVNGGRDAAANIVAAIAVPGRTMDEHAARIQMDFREWLSRRYPDVYNDTHASEGL